MIRWVWLLGPKTMTVSGRIPLIIGDTFLFSGFLFYKRGGLVLLRLIRFHFANFLLFGSEDFIQFIDLIISIIQFL